MYMTLKLVERYDPKLLRIYHIHDAILNEVRDEGNWDGALTLFSTYLAPIIIASQKALAKAGVSSTSTGSSIKEDYRNKNRFSSTSLCIDFDEKNNSDFTKQLNTEDVRLVQYCISSMVRYAPSPTESNILYMFYLQCVPPIRCDETIDICLVSLIYQYAQAKNNPELQTKGRDLIEVALNRGIGLPDYKEIPSRKNRILGQNQKRQGQILANVSEPILRLLNLRISSDGRCLEPRTSHPGSSSNSFQNRKQEQQQIQQPQQPQPQPQQSQQSQQPQRPRGQYQSQDMQSQSRDQPREQQYWDQQSRNTLRREPQQQQSHHRQQQYSQNSHQPRSFYPVSRATSHQSQNDGARQRNDHSSSSHQNNRPQERLTQHQNTHTNKNYRRSQGEPNATRNHVSRTPEDDQYSYYQNASRRGFEGSQQDSHRGGLGGSGSSSRSYGNGSKLRHIPFVPASTNSMLITDNTPIEDSVVVAPTKNEHSQDSDGSVSKHDSSLDLAAEVEKLQLEPQAR
ncbi:hypothetical protein BGZ46_006429 [Entomortierella lignicola]|nr:hypothetical protein BGZ46_006429 [Entomortierella lignicola]